MTEEGRNVVRSFIKIFSQPKRAVFAHIFLYKWVFSTSLKHVFESPKNLFTRKFAQNESVTRTSYKIVHRMAERGKPFTDGNIIKECMMEAANELCPEDIFMEVHKTLQDYNLQWNQLRGVTIDGGKNMAGVKKGLVGLIRKQLEDLQLPSALFIHCIIHQQALCGKDLDISCILKPVISAVNFIWGHALYHHQFKAFLEEIDSDFCDSPYHTVVRWLSCGKVLPHFYKLRREIDTFLIEKYRADPLLSDPTWLLSFLVDITSHMNELNLKLQGKNNLVCDLYRIIKGFRRKLSLFEAHWEGGNLFHFQCFNEFHAGITEDVNLEFQKKIIGDLNKHF
ncbi:general transcription factor II-I repeat domain-containing protein 2 isoform X1 [Tachypleus tridentatus]|uniref:general transcription factor II-I repeat domain-containing protein 2 isoform X1 n=1 Tax=Tachypleus tridentatus TaxID=6853 RepID=UPI003FCF36AF